MTKEKATSKEPVAKTDKVKYIRSRVTETEPGLTEGKKYEFIRWGFYQGAYFTIINDRGEEFSIYDPEKYLHTEDIKGKPSSFDTTEDD